LNAQQVSKVFERRKKPVVANARCRKPFHAEIARSLLGCDHLEYPFLIQRFWRPTSDQALGDNAFRFESLRIDGNDGELCWFRLLEGVIC